VGLHGRITKAMSGQALDVFRLVVGAGKTRTFQAVGDNGVLPLKIAVQMHVRGPSSTASAPATGSPTNSAGSINLPDPSTLAAGAIVRYWRCSSVAAFKAAYLTFEHLGRRKGR
jgi:hypothetical protein